VYNTVGQESSCKLHVKAVRLAGLLVLSLFVLWSFGESDSLARHAAMPRAAMLCSATG
jgi:hypothetical protein